MRYYLDCEFDGHRGPLLSMALVRQHVWPFMASHQSKNVAMMPANQIGAVLRNFISDDSVPEIVADSPVDIGRFCDAISTSGDGNWCSAEYPEMTFRVYNVDCYPTSLEGAVQHNAWWDAMALRAKIEGAAP